MVCSRYKDYCCGICNALATNQEPASVNDVHKPVDPLSGTVKQIHKVDPTLRAKTTNENASGNSGKETTNKPNKDTGTSSNDKNTSPKLTPFGIEIPRSSINGFTIRSHSFQNSPGQMIRTVIYRPVNRRGSVFRRPRPGHRQRLLRRLNFLVNQG